MKYIKPFRTALSMVELVFVIIILGIVSSLGAEIVVQVYDSYIVQRAQFRATMKTELALNQIENRLRYAIPGQVGWRDTKGSTFNNLSATNTGTEKVLQWVAYDGDSFEAITDGSDLRPGWSGFCDIDAYDPVTTPTSLPTPGSNLDLASETISNLGGNIANAVILFEGTPYGISGGTGESITLDNAIPSGDKIYERYKLAWSSYALEVDANSDLILHYNFSPTYGTTINGSSSILLHNVTNFRFKGSEGALRIKICREEKIGFGTSETVHACKERVVF